MKLKFFTLVSFLLPLTAFAQDASVQFNMKRPVGRVITHKKSGESLYLGYFCLEAVSQPDGKQVCIKSQFGKGRDLRLGIDFLGNPSDDLGTWQAVGPVFDSKSGEKFYLASLEGKDSGDFVSIWKAVWSKEGFNWIEKPVEIRKSSFNLFVSLLEQHRVIIPVEKPKPHKTNPTVFGNFQFPVGLGKHVLKSPSIEFQYEISLRAESLIELQSLRVVMPNHPYAMGFRYRTSESSIENANHICSLFGMSGTSATYSGTVGQKFWIYEGDDFSDPRADQDNRATEISVVRCRAAHSAPYNFKDAVNENGATRITQPEILDLKGQYVALGSFADNTHPFCTGLGFEKYLSYTSTQQTGTSRIVALLDQNMLLSNAANAIEVSDRFMSDLTCY